MPEGHTIHRLARDHSKLFKGTAVSVTSPQGRVSEGAAQVDGTVIRRVTAYGKHLFYEFDRAAVVHVHLGLFGKFRTWPGEGAAPEPLPTVRLRIAGERGTVDLVGATCCEIITPAGLEGIVRRLGPDPLRRGADPSLGWAALQRRSGTIGEALMDQRVVAGVGNVYRAEVLHVHGIHPSRPARSVSADEWASIWATLVGWLHDGVRDQVIITVDPALVGTPRRRIQKGEALWVYKQERCRRCGGPVRRWDLKGRWAYACESCQR